MRYEIVSENITKLSTKLGVSSDRLYSAMVVKIKAAFIVPLIQLAACLVISYFLLKGWDNVLPYCKAKVPGLPSYDERSDWPTVISASVVALTLSSAAIAIYGFTLLIDVIKKVIDGWVTPEGSVLTKMLSGNFD